MADKGGDKKVPNFVIGAAAKREVKRALMRSTNPSETISKFQQTRSLHSMFAKAFGTIPQHQYEKQQKGGSDDKAEKESLDTDSVLSFLGHLGVRHYEVHKRIGDTLQKQLEDEIRKVNNQEALLTLLKNCWNHSTTVPELRPILWAVLKQLGEKTPKLVLMNLAKRDSDDPTKLKHAEVFRPLPPLLKRLVWEADWDDKVTVEQENSIQNPKEYLKLVQSTLLYQTVQPLVEKYCSTEGLLEAGSKFFVMTAQERRILTTQRRALAHTSTMGKSGSTANTSATTTSLLGKTAGTGTTVGAVASSSATEPLLTSGKAVSQLRQMLGDNTAGASSTYRPKLLHAMLSMLMAYHGSQAPKILTGTHLHCTLVADVLLSSGGPLPKIYTHVHTLARVLDDAVKNGVLADEDLIKIQKSLSAVYAEEQSEEEKEEEEPKAKNAKKKGKKSKKKTGEDEDRADGDSDSDENAQPTTFIKRQLNRIITAGLVAMKDSDPQKIFLNTVTDAIAPGYSKVIKKPMSISTMETKIENNVYNTIDDWNSDVRLMFKNCVDYNRGQAGQWFRGEANRQLKVYKDEILPQAEKLYQVELEKRNPEPEQKRKREEEVINKPKLSPLDPINKKRKIDPQEYTLSMPALAAMLLADPFVVRLLLERVLRSLRVDVLRGSTIPVAHSVVPSILQLLHMAQWSTHICAARGRRYLVPDSGATPPDSSEAIEAVVPFDSLRRYMPILMHLLLEADLDKRFALGGDLNPVVDSMPRPSPPSVTLTEGAPPMQVAVALLEGAFVYACLPYNSKDSSLAITFKNFSNALLELNGSVWEETALFKCLVPAILKHKTRLNRTVRDAIIETWTDWIKTSDNSHTSKKKKKKIGCMTSPVHEYFMVLLNGWANFGNQLIPRDSLLEVCLELVNAVNETESAPERKFAALWKGGDKAFEPIKDQYDIMLKLLPESHSSQFKEATNVEEKKSEEAEEAAVSDDVDNTENQATEGDDAEHADADMMDED